MANETKMKITNEGVYQSGIVGITWEKNIDTWRAAISVNGITYTLGFNPNLCELIPIMEKARAKKEEGEASFLMFYEEELGKTKRVVVPCEFQSDVVGVSFNPRSNKWVAAISIENRKYTLGTFENQVDAETLRLDADKIKDKCEHTTTDSGIIDYTPLYNLLEDLRIERQQSRLDARIGTGHGKRAWRRLKKEEHALEDLVLKKLRGDLRKELSGYTKGQKANVVKALDDYPTIRFSSGSYYVFVKRNDEDREYYIGKSIDLLGAILLYEVGIAKLNSDTWVDWYETEIDMGLKKLSMEDILDELDLSMDRYNKLKSLMSSNCSTYSNSTTKELANDVFISYKDYRPMIEKNPILDKARLVFAGVTYIVKDNVKYPLKGFSMKIEPNEKVSLTNDMIDDLFNIEDVKNHIESGDFYYWYIFESGLFN